MKTTTVLSLAVILTLSSCAFFSKKTDNSVAISKYQNKMRSIASSGGGQLQLPPGYKIYKAALTTVGPDSDVILFYKDGNEIVIKECEHYSVINNISDCKAKSWLTRPIRVAVSEFKNRIKSALRIQTFDTLGQQQAKQLKNYREYRERLTQKPSTEDLVQQRDEVQSKVSKIEAFIEAYGEENANTTEELLTLRQLLATLNSKVKDRKKFSDTVESLNASIDQLVDDLIGSSQMNTMRYSKDKTGIEYSVLRTYVRPYLAQTAFVPVKAGTFNMGSPLSENDRDEDELQHQVTLTKDFEIGSTEVTQLQWVVVMGSNPSRFKEESYCPESYMEINGVSLCSDFPVERVSWNDVKEYISAYNKRAKDNFTYRLPTEAEWEFAARAGTSTAYSFGNSSSELTDYAWFSENSRGQTRAVATKKPNPLGIYDVHGNVWEWVEDWYGKYPNRSVTDPRGLRSVLSRVGRGGSWQSDKTRYLRSANRSSDEPEYSWANTGFRLVRTPNN